MRNLIKKTKIMYCKSCGKTIDDDSKYCIHCGTKLFSSDISAIDENEKVVETFDSSKIKTKTSSSSKSIKPIRNKHFSTFIQDQKNILEEFAGLTENNQSPKRIIGIIFAFIGSFLLSWVVSFSMLSEQSTTQNYIISLAGILFISRNHLLAYSLVPLIIASILISKDRIIFNKILSIAIDGLALFLSLYGSQYLLIGKDTDSSLTSYFLYYNVFTNKIITWSLFLLIYYLIAELLGGTLGKKIAGLISQNQERMHISLKQSIQKALIYGTPIWILLISFLWNPQILNQFSDSIFFHFCQWLYFILFFISLFMIFISKENNSLADFFSKTTVAKKSDQILISNPTSSQSEQIKNPEVLESLISNASDLHKLVLTEKKKIFPGRNKLITDKLEELFRDKNSFFIMNDIYKNQYSKEIPEHLMSISSAYGLIYYYIEPIIKLGVCDEDYPHKICAHGSYFR